MMDWFMEQTWLIEGLVTMVAASNGGHCGLFLDRTF